MLNSRVKWVMVLLVLFFISLSCSKKEEEPRTDARQETPAEQKSAITGQGQGGTMGTAGADGTKTATASATAEAERSGSEAPEAQGEEIYQRTCSSCHATGVAGAPRIGDAETWSSLIAKGEEQLVKNAIDGIGTMPAKGGNPSLSDEEVRSAVLYMLEQSR